jgi:hypothetical protein
VEACVQEFRIFPTDKAQQFSSLCSEFLSFLLTIPFENQNVQQTFSALFESIQRFVQWGLLLYKSSLRFDSANPTLLLACIRYLYGLRNLPSDLTKATLPADESKILSETDGLLSAVFERISMMIEQESEKKPLFSVQFLETLANSSGKIDALARSTAKAAYKKCKKAEESIVDRMAMIKFD